MAQEAHRDKAQVTACKMRLWQNVNEDGPARRMQYCEWVVNRLDGISDFPPEISFIDEANFYFNGEVN
jgi:hypothetical protein